MGDLYRNCKVKIKQENNIKHSKYVKSNDKRGKHRTAKKAIRTNADILYREKGTIIKKQKNLIKVALVYPNTYEAGMSSLGFQTVYGLINEIDYVVCERVFLPDNKIIGCDTIKSCESGSLLSHFDIIAFSVSFENDYLNIISLLKNSGIPPRSAKRNQAISPLVIAGGVACFLNPEPLASFIDIFLLGEAEFLIKDFFHLFDPIMDRENLKRIIARELNGAYVPSFYLPSYNEDGKFVSIVPIFDDIPKRIKPRFIKDLSSVKTTSVIVTPKTVFKDIFLIETGRGCPHGCRFCSAGFIYRPPRFYPKNIVIEAMERADKITKRIGLVSAAVSDHPGINEICSSGIEKGFKISFSSLRVDALSDDLIKSLVVSGVKTATIAPEAGSERMRNIINKKIKEKDILSASKRLVEAGIMNLKLYFMIGLPFEKDDDAHAIVTLTKKIMEAFTDASRPKGRIGIVTLSINPFIPKPSTPFQWSPMATKRMVNLRINIIRRGLKSISNIRIKTESYRIARINALLSRGDRRMGDILESACELGWANAIKHNKEYCESQLYEMREFDDGLAWDIIETGIKKEFLFNEYVRAGNQKTSADCPMIPCDKCRRCKQDRIRNLK